MVAIVGVLALLRGRAQLPAAPRARTAAQEAPASAPPGAKFVNPVCGMAVDIAAPKHIERYEGVAYYFCCDGCLATFRQDPAKYAAIHRAASTRSVAA
jgi:xanthine dehydrogenase accessory factor